MIDYEVEYNNRARVPEHPEIFARWVREAARYRAERQTECAFDIAYGPGGREKYDFFPARERRKAAGLLFIHGGYWQSLGKSTFSHLAKGANLNGIDVAVAGYTLCPETTIAGIIDEMRHLLVELARQRQQPFVVAGHSAGGHLSAVLAASDWKAIAPDLTFNPVVAAMPISGIYELEPLIVTSINHKVGLDQASAAAASPFFMPAPKGMRVICVVGARESPEFLRQQRVFVDHWRRQGSIIHGVEMADADHFTVIDPLSDANSDLVQAITSLADY